MNKLLCLAVVLFACALPVQAIIVINATSVNRIIYSVNNGGAQAVAIPAGQKIEFDCSSWGGFFDEGSFNCADMQIRFNQSSILTLTPFGFSSVGRWYWADSPLHIGQPGFTNAVPVSMAVPALDYLPSVQTGFALGLGLFGFGWVLRLAKSVATPDRS